MPQLGRALQLLGMLVLPVGLGMGLFGNNINAEVKLLWIGGGLFLLGWLLTKKAAS